MLWLLFACCWLRKAVSASGLFPAACSSALIVSWFKPPTPPPPPPTLPSPLKLCGGSYGVPRGDGVGMAVKRLLIVPAGEAERAGELAMVREEEE